MARILCGNVLGAQSPANSHRLALRVDTAEASAVLSMLVHRAKGEPISDSTWRALYALAGYQRLKERELSMQRSFADSDFVSFVLSDSLGRSAAALRRTLTKWSKIDLQSAAQRAMAYLPANARIQATIYIVIKPKTNSFVWDVERNPAIFLYLDPDKTSAQLANVVAHELHHIGFASVRQASDSIRRTIPDSARVAADWIGAFGEGFAMLAAAGGASVHPHADSPLDDRVRWDRDLKHFNQDVGTLNAFFVDVLSHRLTSTDAIGKVAITYYGVQGPWYTVGWRMAVLVEQASGRAELIQCMNNPLRLLQQYNAVASRYNRTHRDTVARWSDEFVNALRR